MSQEPNRHPIQTQRGAFWLALGVGLALMVLTLWLWQICRANERRTIEKLGDRAAASVQAQIALTIRPRIQELRHIAMRLALPQAPIARQQWENEARLYREEYPCLAMMGWIDPAFRMKWLYPANANGITEGLDLSRRKIFSRFGPAFEKARQGHDFV